MLGRSQYERGNKMNVIAWTGGSRPARWNDTQAQEKKLARDIFRGCMLEVFNYWGDFRGLNDSVLDMARIQWKRARYNAHATFRD